jgi:hypothetical protein
LPSLKPLFKQVFNIHSTTNASNETPQRTGNGPRSGAWGSKKKSTKGEFETTIGGNDNDDASVSRLRGDTYWAPTTTAYATNEHTSTEEIQLQDVKKGENTINVKNTINVRKDYDWEANSN